MGIVIEPAPAPTEEVRSLIAELDAALGALYPAHQRHAWAIERLFEAGVLLFLARLGGAALGCGGIALFDGYAEVKRMYTRPAARRRGLAKALLQHLECAARAAGKPALRLETGVRQTEAIGLYEGAGFRPCAPFGDYAAMPAANIATSRFFEKPLDGQRCVVAAAAGGAGTWKR